MKTNTLRRWNKLILAFVASLALMLTMSAGTLTVSADPLDGPDGAVVELDKQSGDTKWYDSVQDALDEAHTDDTVKLLQDVVLTEAVTVTDTGADFNLDLNGHSLSADDGVPYALVVGDDSSVYEPTVTLKDSQNLDSACITSEDNLGSNPIVLVEQGELIIRDGGKVSSIAEGVVVNGGNLTVRDGGTIYSYNGPGIDVRSTASTVNIEGGHIQIYEEPDPNVEFRVAVNVKSVDTISISGGRIDGTVEGEGAEGFITGGTFRPCPEDKYIADGYTALYEPDFGQYTIVENKNTVVFEPAEPVYDPFGQTHGQRVTAKLIGADGSELNPTAFKWYKYNEELNSFVEMNQYVANPYLDDATRYRADVTYNDVVTSAEVIVQPYDISDCDYQATAKTFTGFDFDITKGITIARPGEGTLKDFTYELKSVSGNRDAGTCNFTIEGTGNYTGELTDSFSILPADFNDVDFTLSTTEVTWKDDPWEPEVSGTYTTGEGESARTYTLDPSEYNVEYSDNKDPGTATVTITRKGDNFTGDDPKVLQFQILPAVAKVTDGENTGYFPTAAEAFAAAEDGDSVVLLANCDEEASITVNKNITIDLGEYDLGSADKRFDVEVAAGKNLELKGSGKIHGQVANNGTLAIKGGEILYGEGDDSIFSLENHGNVTISGGVIKGGIKNYADATATITGGTIFGELWSVTPSVYAISGGYFDREVNVNHCAENYLPVTAEEGAPAPYTVARTYWVTFDLNGHEGPAPDRQRVIAGKKAAAPEVIVSGTEGVGKWYKNDACTEEWDFDTNVVEEDTILYAKWQHYHDGIFFDEWTSDDSLPVESGNYILMNDVTISDIWDLPQDLNINLCLNGKTVTKDNSEGNDGVIIVERSTLSIYDHDNAGKITGGYNEKTPGYHDISTAVGGGISILNRGVLNLYGGQISGNTGNSGGVDVLGTFNMYGGIISNNTSLHGGGGVGVYKRYDWNACTFNMYGGTISDNTASRNGGGVDLGTGTINLMGGTISGNSHGSEGKGAGIFAGYDSSSPVFNIGSSEYSSEPIIVTGNNDDNIYLDYRIDGYDGTHGGGGKTIFHVTAPLHDDTKLAFSMYIGNQLKEIGSKLPFTEGLAHENGKPANFIYEKEYNMDSHPYRIMLDEESGEMVMMKAFTVSYDSGEGSGEKDPDLVNSGDKIQLPSNPFEEPEGKQFVGWTIGDSDTLRDVGYEYTPTANVTLTAQYKEEVAEITETGEKYVSLDDARNAITSDNQTIKLLKDYSCGAGSFDTRDKVFTLDLNGHQIFSSGEWAVWADSDITIKDSSEGEKGKIISRSDKSNAAAVHASANVTIESGTMEGANYGVMLFLTDNVTREVVINGGTIIGGNKSINNPNDEGLYSVSFKINGGRFSDDEGNGDLYERPEGQLLYKDGEDGYYHLAEHAVVSFDAGGEEGDKISGFMISEVAGKGLKYKLPVCRFINEMHTFDGWIVGDQTYSAGDLIEIDEDTTVTAKWKADDMNLFIQGTKVTGENYQNVLGDNTVKVAMDQTDPENVLITITLDNATIETNKREDGNETDSEFGVRYNVPNSSLIFDLKGTNKIINATTDGGTAIEQAMAMYQAKTLTFTGDGTLSIEMEAESSQIGYIGIDSRQKTVIDGAKLSVNIPGNGAARGYHQEYSNILSVENGGELYINTGNSDKAYSIYTQRQDKKLVSVSEGSRLELKSSNMALSDMTQVTDETKALGALVSEDTDPDNGVVWDNETPLNNYKYILIPYTTDKSALEEALQTAKDAESGVKETTKSWEVLPSEKWTTPDERLAFDEAIAAAQAVFDDPAINQKKIDDAVGALNEATETFKQALKNGTMGVDPKQRGKDGTPTGKGASEACADKAITSSTSEEGPKGTQFAPLRLKSIKQGNTTITLTWTKPSGATKYVIYGVSCGKGKKLKKITTTAKTSYTVKKIGSSKLKKGTYYRFIVVALDKNKNVVSTSKAAHVATKGGKVTNYKSVTTKASKNRVSIKRGSTFKLGAKAVKQSVKLKIDGHRGLRYVSTNTKVATVSTKGTIKGKSKGSCYVYVYAQNGVFKKIKVTVK